MESSFPLPHPIVLQLVGYKNSGKTTLIIDLIRRLKQDGYSVGTAKHDAHHYQMDYPGTDSWKHQEAGADVTAITSANQSTILRSFSESLPALLKQMNEVHIVLVEGFKQESYPKLILIRSEEDFTLLEVVSNPIAVIVWPQAWAAWHTANKAGDSYPLPCFAISSTNEIYAFLSSHFF
ncbi:hypothetical protein Back11_60610 [Paenibacillus baekrokdamisoli]|uniref:Uncharacterized protein n=1 Tax=Paenibacillus baekrokdamisoli TaxID=1712516 RepID=A0A3G9J1T0_9BACL|nr:molybdopterin-guanine dinucleotide biosynthesis protein B [Paenibacillus baekrokdamisoli]MBB3072132.1 molybdopterin-guanine dinucleotide biosynthesis protein B [Paenibacillus baekrokdamisoli]BBH24716.1 hypothetical protein Back11_60610 [Paenibacillus baekrokdamisoli]